jgi:hypothetical protein
MTPFGVMPMPSNERRPTAVRSTMLVSPVQPAAAGGETHVGVPPTNETPVVVSGSISSNSRPLVPFSSANTMVPHGVRCAGSQLTSPEFTIVSASPSEIRMRCNATWPEPSSLHAMSQVGFVSLGQSAIMSMTGAAMPPCSW